MRLGLLFFLTAPLLAQPLPEHGLYYDTPAETWDEAMPLGNGLLGALVWGDGHPVNVSLDRTDLWDLRPVPEFHSEDYSYETMRQWIADGRHDDLVRLYERPYSVYPGPTKIPAGRIELHLPIGAQFASARLDIAGAVTTTTFTDGTRMEVLVHALDPVGLIRIEGPAAALLEPELVAPPFGGTPAVPDPQDMWELELAHLGYPPPSFSQTPRGLGYQQEGWGGFVFAVALEWRQVGQTWIGAWSVQTNAEGQDPLAEASRNARHALESGWITMRQSHHDWWSAYWDRSTVLLPNPILERQWALEMYKFGAAARHDTPPITLQGPWTADNGSIPPWKGDYHHDLNTQLSYWPSYAGNQLEGSEGFVEWLWQTRPNAEAWTRRFFNMPGLNVPMTADLNNEQIGGWHPYTHSATTSAWLAHHFYLHTRYTADPDFLRDRAYPWLREVAVFLEAITERDPAGVRFLPLSSSPEINDNRLDAWFEGTTNYDLALIRWTFEKAAELAEEVGESEEADRWRRNTDELPDFALGSDGRLLVAPGYPLQESHRHFSHLMAIHPLGLVDWNAGEADKQIIRASLAELDSLGTSLWTGYSFSWLAGMRARARDGAGAEKALEIFSTAFCLRNSFHVNGDQSGKGYSNFTYRPFTLEGNFAAASAIHEMLLQSHNDTAYVFPAIPAAWDDVAFRTLRAQGGVLVSAERLHGRTIRVEFTSERGGTFYLEDPFDGGAVELLGPPIRFDTSNPIWMLDLPPGGTVVMNRL